MEAVSISGSGSVHLGIDYKASAHAKRYKQANKREPLAGKLRH